MNRSINERIKDIMEYYGLNPNSFSKTLGMAQNATIHHIVKGEVNPSYATISMILSRFSEVSADWLIKGDGNMFKTDTPPPIEVEDRMSGEEARQIRESFGMTLYEFAELINLGSHMTVHNNESRDRVTKGYERKVRDLVVNGNTKKNNKTIRNTLNQVKDGSISVDKALKIIEKLIQK